VLRPGARPGTTERLRAAVVAQLEDAGALDPRVDVVAVAAIDRQTGPGAKRTMVR
jgi:hypothetical protein